MKSDDSLNNQSIFNKSNLSSSPAKLILSGEYSVLLGHKALSLAINKLIQIQVTISDSKYLEINSDYFGQYSVLIKNIDKNLIEYNENFKLLLSACYILKIQCGLKINITSDINPKHGLGSSGAFLIAFLESLNQLHLLDFQYDKYSLFNLALKIANLTYENNYGSGLDLATSLYKGLITFQNNNSRVNVQNLDYNFLSENYNLFYIYTGEKIKTPEVLSKLNKNNPKFIKICNEIAFCTDKIEKAIYNKDKVNFINEIKINHNLLCDLGVSNKNIDDIVQKVSLYGLTAKISGSGFGDSLIAFGDKKDMINIEKLKLMYPVFNIDLYS